MVLLAEMFPNVPRADIEHVLQENGYLAAVDKLLGVPDDQRDVSLSCYSICMLHIL